MKKLLILFVLTLLPLAASASRPVNRTVSKARLTALISEMRGYDGVEAVRLGALPTAAIKSILRATARRDEDAREALKLLRGVRRVSVLDYEDCSPAVRERIADRLDRALVRSELLMEAKGDDSAMQIFGVVDEKTGTVRDFVLHAPDDYTLICIFGSISMDAVGKVLADD